jgi:hypothetical protein
MPVRCGARRMHRRMPDPADPPRVRGVRFLVALASVCALVVIAGLVLAWLGPPPPRDVIFTGEIGRRSVGRESCHGPAFWTGEVAWATCDWFYRDRALVELDPESGRATSLYEWSLDDGNTPELSIVRPCGDGRLFAIGETAQTTLVTLRSGAASGSAVQVPGERVLGAECRDGGVELFVQEPEGHSIRRARDGRLEPVQVIAAGDLPGRVLGAWFESGRWHVLVQKQSERDKEKDAVVAGPLGEGLSEVYAARRYTRICLMGEPGGWMCNTPGAEQLLTRAGGVYQATPIGRSSGEPIVLRALQAGAPPIRAVRGESGRSARFGGLGAVDFELAERGSAWVAKRDPGDGVVVAKSAFSSLGIGPKALPLSGDRVAIWGGLGGQLIVLGPDLRRMDPIGVAARTLRPLGRFRASSTSIFDQICYFALLLATPAWFVLLAVARRGQKIGDWQLRRFALLFLALAIIGARGFYNVLLWI